MTISEIITEVMGDVGADTTDSGLTALMLTWTKATLRRFPRFARNRMMRAKKSGSLSAAASTMSVPSGVVDILKLFYEESGERKEIERPGIDKFTEEYRGEGSGPPQYCIVRTNTVEFDRPADQAYTIYYECNQEIDAVASSDTWSYSSDKAEILKDGMKFYYYGYVEDSEKRDESKGNFKAGLDTLETEYIREEIPDHVEEA